MQIAFVLPRLGCNVILCSRTVAAGHRQIAYTTGELVDILLLLKQHLHFVISKIILIMWICPKIGLAWRLLWHHCKGKWLWQSVDVY